MFKSLKSIITHQDPHPIAEKYLDFRKIIIKLSPEAHGIKPSLANFLMFGER